MRYLERQRLGQLGERAAARFLKKKGYHILEKNYRVRSGEVDIVAREKGSIVFVEVKTRSSAEFGLPEESLSSRKKVHLTKTALSYLAHHSIRDRDCRFDVVAVIMKGGRVEEIRLIRNAFESSL